MHLFNILNFRTATLHQLEDYLRQHNSLRYEITIPKQEFDNKDADLVRWQYYMAAYAGHRLSLVCTSFSYNVPCPWRPDPFQFHVESIDHQKLAAVLLGIIAGYFKGRNEYNLVQNEALRHFSNCFSGKSDSGCWGLLHVANSKF